MDSETSNERYVYQALSYEAHHHPIRLLKILPGEPSSQIYCDLFHTHLATAGDASAKQDSGGGTVLVAGPEDPAYTALSYVWGDHTDTVPIQVCGKELSVTRNLFKFLERHRDTFLSNRSTEPLFWIDAICIDQSNIEERSRQVAFMAEIYKKAQNVLVWLGEETEYTSKAFETVRKLTDDYELSDEEYGACSTLFKGGWWDRLWVIQEAVHARSLVVRCGTLEIGWVSLKEKVGGVSGPFNSFETIADCREGALVGADGI